MSPLWILLLLPLFGVAERFNCKGRILGAYYADAKSGCKAFHVCVRVAGGGIRDFRFYCPPGTLFHQEAQTCTDWGDDDPLACPADIYDGQFDLYKIGSGFDTKKVSSSVNHVEEPEFSLQRAETGDRRLAQNSAPSGPASDLRAAHSSDFFSGQRERGRDEPTYSTPSTQTTPPAPPTPSPTPFPRQSFRRATSARPQPTTKQYIAPSSSPLPSNPPKYDIGKRKVLRKRPLHVTTAAPITFIQSSPPQQPYSQSPLPSTQPPQQYSQPPQQNSQIPQQNFNRRIPTPHRETLPPLPNVPPQYKEYKDEYVEVSRVTPKQNKYFPNQNNQSPPQTSQTTPTQQFQKKEGLIEVYNYEAQSTPGLNSQNEKQRPFKVRNNFSVSDISREPDFTRTRNVNNNLNNVRGTASPADYTVVTRSPTTTTVTFNNYNSVSYEPEKNNFIPFSKQNYFNNPTSAAPAPTTTVYTTTRPEPPPNVNTVAYNTNIGFHTQSNYADSAEDDGQYRHPQGEDDGQYRPELYERELLSGAHSLNIAASGNRLPEDQKTRGKTQSPPKYGQTAVPRPFRPASSTQPPPTQTTNQISETYPTTHRPAPKTQRAFDPIQTYTTTSRPSEVPEAFSNAPAQPSTTQAPRPTKPAPRPTRPPHYAHPTNNKEDTSYDYAYYDSDPGFSEYDNIEEFGRTKTRA